jgi:cellulose synthase/poly-beta-1,6-N-acetylglucosamine synthase-like glycosyltransferase
MVLIYITLFLLALYGALMLLYYRWWKQAPEFDNEKIVHFFSNEKITVVVPARNEAANIVSCLQHLTAQNYPSSLLEIIVVNDQSGDNTATLVQSFSEKGVKLINIPNETLPVAAPKKRAIETAVQQATGSLIVTTDADCTMGTDWIKTIAAFHSSTNKVFVTAPVKMNENGSLLSIFQVLDFSTMQAITAAATSRNFHHMCNGANLTYEKNVFNAVNGFEGINSIASGDDMLLLQKVLASYPDSIGFVKNEKAIVTTNAERSWTSFFQQRIRWASKNAVYKEKQLTTVLTLIYFLNSCLIATFITAFWYPKHWLYLIALFLLKFLVEFPLVQSALQFFGQQRLIVYLLLLQPLHAIYIVLAGLLGQIKTYRWKGRKLK